MRSTTTLLRDAVTPYSAAHKSYIQSLYRRYLKTALDWDHQRWLWRQSAIQIRVDFEKNRKITNPRELAVILQKAEENLENMRHPEPIKPPMAEGGTKWERNIPPPVPKGGWT